MHSSDEQYLEQCRLIAQALNEKDLVDAFEWAARQAREFSGTHAATLFEAEAKAYKYEVRRREGQELINKRRSERGQPPITNDRIMKDASTDDGQT